jgi:hypothetical protein
MSVIENFAELSFEEQKKFAEALVETINSECTFTDQVDFKVTKVEANEMTGGLVIDLEHEDTIEVERDATWQCSSRDDVEDTPDDPDYAEHIMDDIESAFKTLAAELEGYSITLQVDYWDEVDTVDVKADYVSDEDSGIGRYEFWGEIGYDSHPYCEVTGTITQACAVDCSLHVEAADHFEVEPEEK